MPHFDIDIRDLSKSFSDARALDDACLRVPRGEILSVLGPSGCGKSTLLHLLAGHLAPDSGSIAIGGRLVAGGGSWLGPDRREVGMVFQDYALFPHLDVAQNVGFSVRSRRERAGRVDELLRTFEISHLAKRLPHELSGGQQQRVAIARALAQRPRILLLDEPFSSLDAGTREQVRGEIVQRLRDTGLTCVFVTHDQEEALAISDRIAVMQAGKIVQVDAPETLYRRPFCLEVAEFLGKTNVLDGIARSGMVTTLVGSFPLADAAHGSVQVLVRPELIDIAPDETGEAIVVAREFRGHDVLYRLQLSDGTRVWAHRPSVGMADVGQRVTIRPQAALVSLFRPEHGALSGVDPEPAAVGAHTHAEALDVPPAPGAATPAPQAI